jgi:hypothetical protein
MTHRPQVLRFGWLLAAIFQIAVAPFASIADARAEAASISAAPNGHVEDFGAKGCPRHHADDCVVCRYLTLGAARSSTPAVLVAVVRTCILRLADYRGQRAVARAPGDPPQRAPPV